MKNMVKKLLRDESGQGAIEYVFLVLVLVAIAVIFKDNIKGAASDKINELAEQIRGFSGE